jgi:hypothetical protein
MYVWVGGGVCFASLRFLDSQLEQGEGVCGPCGEGEGRLHRCGALVFVHIEHAVGGSVWVWGLCLYAPVRPRTDSVACRFSSWEFLDFKGHPPAVLRPSGFVAHSTASLSPVP